MGIENIDELIANLKDDNGYGKFIVLEMKERFDSLEDADKMKIINTLSATTKANKSLAESKKKKMDSLLVLRIKEEPKKNSNLC